MSSIGTRQSTRWRRSERAAPPAPPHPRNTCSTSSPFSARIAARPCLGGPTIHHARKDPTMKHVRFLAALLLGVFLGISATAQANRPPAPPASAPQAANGTAFTYQGRLTDGGAAATGA